MPAETTHPSRRAALTLLGASALGVTMIPRNAFAAASGSAPTRLLAAADICVITPETTAGPFYFDPRLVRSDITDGRSGLPLRLRLQVVDEVCAPIETARIDIWHCDALGQYSGYPDQPGSVSTVGKTFLRGTQFTDAAGLASFESIYPGWYPGRTPHIHFRVFIGDTDTLTGQIFFDDAVSDRVYAEHADYARQGNRGTRNGNDGIARAAGSAALAQVDALPDAYEAAMIIGLGKRAGA